MQDVFIDRKKWLDKSWPLVAHHHLDALADRLARSRSRYVMSLLVDCCEAAGSSASLTFGIKSAWMLASPGARYRFAQHVVFTLKDGILFLPSEAEVFDPDIVTKLGQEVIQDYRKRFR